MQAFSPDAARAVDGPFADHRAAAAERAAAAAWPTPAEEIWRYSRIDELDLDRFTPATATTTDRGSRPAASSPICPTSPTSSAGRRPTCSPS